MKKITTGIILLALILGTFSCGSEPSGTNETTTSDTDAAEETTSGSGLPKLDYNGDTVTILVEDYGGYCGVDFYVEESNGDIVNDAVYNRNQSVEQSLNVNLEWVGITHAWDDREDFLTKFRSSVLAGDGAYEIAAGLGYFMPSFVSDGLLSDMSTLPYINLQQPWWSKNFSDNSAVDGRYYFATGDISLGLIKNMFCIFENLELAETLGVENLYDVVRDGNWTLEKMIKISADIYSDIDGDTTVGQSDRFGLLLNSGNHITGFIEPFNVNIIEFSGSEPEFVFGNAHNTDVVEKLSAMINDNDGIFFDTKGEQETAYNSIFRNGNVLLATGWLMHTDSYRDLTYDYGVLPYPKYDESQTEYKTTVLTTYSVVTVPVDSKNKERAAAVCEALAYESWNSVTPAYFETALKVKYARDNDSTQMFDIIREGVSFDFGYIYTLAFDGISDRFKDAVERSEAWASKIESIRQAQEEKLSTLVESIRENIE